MCGAKVSPTGIEEDPEISMRDAFCTRVSSCFKCFCCYGSCFNCLFCITDEKMEINERELRNYVAWQHFFILLQVTTLMVTGSFMLIFGITAYTDNLDNCNAQSAVLASAMLGIVIQKIFKGTRLYSEETAKTNVEYSQSITTHCIKVCFSTFLIGVSVAYLLVLWVDKNYTNDPKGDGAECKGSIELLTVVLTAVFNYLAEVQSVRLASESEINETEKLATRLKEVGSIDEKLVDRIFAKYGMTFDKIYLNCFSDIDLQDTDWANYDEISKLIPKFLKGLRLLIQKSDPNVDFTKLYNQHKDGAAIHNIVAFLVERHQRLEKFDTKTQELFDQMQEDSTLRPYVSKFRRQNITFSKIKDQLDYTKNPFACTWLPGSDMANLFAAPANVAQSAGLCKMVNDMMTEYMYAKMTSSSKLTQYVQILQSKVPKVTYDVVFNEISVSNDGTATFKAMANPVCSSSISPADQAEFLSMFLDI